MITAFGNCIVSSTLISHTTQFYEQSINNKRKRITNTKAKLYSIIENEKERKQRMSQSSFGYAYALRLMME